MTYREAKNQALKLLKSWKIDEIINEIPVYEQYIDGDNIELVELNQFSHLSGEEVRLCLGDHGRISIIIF